MKIGVAMANKVFLQKIQDGCQTMQLQLIGTFFD